MPNVTCLNLAAAAQILPHADRCAGQLLCNVMHNRLAVNCTSVRALLPAPFHAHCLVDLMHTLVECVLAPLRCRCVQADTLAAGDAALLAAAHEALEHFVTAAVEHRSLVALKHSQMLLDRALVGLPGEWWCGRVRHLALHSRPTITAPQVDARLSHARHAHAWPPLGAWGVAHGVARYSGCLRSCNPACKRPAGCVSAPPRRLGSAAGAAQAPATGAAARGAASAGRGGLCAAGAGCVGTGAVSAGLQAMRFALGLTAP